MKVKEIPGLKQKVLDILPITQSELWKMLKIDHRDASELVSIMVKENLIKKKKVEHTFLLESQNGDKEKKTFGALISGSGKFSPCTGCLDVCSPPECRKLAEWILDVKEETKEEEEKVKEKIKEETKEEEEKVKEKIKEETKEEEKVKEKVKEETKEEIKEVRNDTLEVIVKKVKKRNKGGNIKVENKKLTVLSA